MELLEITARPEVPRRLRTADVPGTREVRITLRYGEPDIEAVAEAVGLELGCAERDSMLLLLDDAVAEVVTRCVRTALGDRIREEIGVLEMGHTMTEDE